MTDRQPVDHWDTDFDILNPAYVADPFSIWDELRRTCPVAHTDRRGSTWLPTRYQDVVDLAHDVEHFSSTEIAVIPFDGEVPDDPVLPYGVPPISADPPLHTWTRRLLLPWFSHGRVASYEAMTRHLCVELVDGFIDDGAADAARDYAQQIPVRVIAGILGVPISLSDTFTGWVRDVLEFADDPVRRERGTEALITFFVGEVARRKSEPGEDLLSDLLHSEFDGAPVEESVVLGIAALVLIAGVDTTWSAIGSSLWHLATHAGDRDRLVAEPDAMPVAIEELLRAYSPVTMARVVTEDIEFEGCAMKAGDKVLMNFPAANRDPEAFEEADRVVLDRELNRHVAFGSGIHRCAGSNLARMELRVALEEWLRRIPVFRLEEGEEATWAGGQVRGPRRLPMVFR
ncbi:MAG TPA: cytochrome P450 [Acidimicrobiales bacterium]|nr:cytochrome P450 [Acidimicrobiales bacterium]HVB94068.1 cytochrome P450 [Acidimicrobiales bacterium]